MLIHGDKTDQRRSESLNSGANVYKARPSPVFGRLKSSPEHRDGRAGDVFLAATNASLFKGLDHPADYMTTDTVDATLPVLDGIFVETGRVSKLALRHTGKNPRSLEMTSVP